MNQPVFEKGPSLNNFRMTSGTCIKDDDFTKDYWFVPRGFQQIRDRDGAGGRGKSYLGFRFVRNKK